MGRRLMLLAALTAAWIVPFIGAKPAAAQDAAAACASEFWLADESRDEAGAEIAEITDPAPAWMTTELTDACSGEPFALADFAGQTVYVESMATWCPPCRDQLARVKEAAAQIPEDEREEIVFVALSSEVDLPREMLAQYALDNDFSFVFAVMPAEMLQAMVEDLGQEVAVPPATPHLIVAPDGTVGDVHTGTVSPEDLLDLLADAAAAGAP